MRLISIILIIIAFSSCINGVFVFDRSLLRNLNRTKIQKDPVGSAIYASFTYGGICPSGSAGPLPGISIHAATGTQSTCFTDDSIAAEDVSIGYVCFPGSPATVYISYPGTNGLIIGGPSFIATGDQNYGYAWGRIGAPTFGAPVSTSCTASCVATCSASYCNPSCEARCDSNPSCIGTDNSVTCTNNQGVATGGTLYFIPTGSTPDNCGTSGGHCCSTFTYPAPVEYRYWKLTATDLGASPGDPYWQISEFNFLKLGNRIPSVSQTSVGNDPQGDFPNSGSPGGEDATKIDDDNKDTKFLAAKKSGVVFDFGTAKSFDQYQWYTANDASWRDMTGWTLEASNDNIAWTLIDTKTSQTITTNRKSLVGPFTIST